MNWPNGAILVNMSNNMRTMLQRLLLLRSQIRVQPLDVGLQIVFSARGVPAKVAVERQRDVGTRMNDLVITQPLAISIGHAAGGTDERLSLSMTTLVPGHG